MNPHDTYMRFIMTVIAVSLAVIALKDIDLVSNAYAELDSGDSIRVKLDNNDSWKPLHVKIVE